jgi:hypothetical protein
VNAATFPIINRAITDAEYVFALDAARSAGLHRLDSRSM